LNKQAIWPRRRKRRNQNIASWPINKIGSRYLKLPTSAFIIVSQRVKTELESGKKWNENWGTLFGGGVPNDYTERVKFLEGELKK
jgi:hypothetical protein